MTLTTEFTAEQIVRVANFNLPRRRPGASKLNSFFSTVATYYDFTLRGSVGVARGNNKVLLL